MTIPRTRIRAWRRLRAQVCRTPARQECARRHRRDLLWLGDVDRMADSLNLGGVAASSCGIPSFQVGIDDSVFCRHHHPARLLSPSRRSDGHAEIDSCVEYLQSCHKGCLSVGTSAAKYFGGSYNLCLASGTIPPRVRLIRPIMAWRCAKERRRPVCVSAVNVSQCLGALLPCRHSDYTSSN
ncbi:MAG: hypothetical protein JWQ42_3158 [Edaphobacter sp.]|nr:hypothetical protein [Edaphobacter sp.]